MIHVVFCFFSSRVLLETNTLECRGVTLAGLRIRNVTCVYAWRSLAVSVVGARRDREGRRICPPGNDRSKIHV